MVYNIHTVCTVVDKSLDKALVQPSTNFSTSPPFYDNWRNSIHPSISLIAQQHFSSSPQQPPFSCTPHHSIFTEMAAAAAAAAKKSEDPLAKQFAKLAGMTKPGRALRKPGELKKRHSASTLSMPTVGEGPEGAAEGGVLCTCFIYHFAV